MMNWRGFRRKRLWPNLRYYFDIRLDRLNKTTTSVRRAGLRGRDLTPVPVEYEAGVLTTRPRRSVIAYKKHQ
jgi:hypothetical protein